MFTAKSFSIPKLVGISEATILEHIKLYEGYVNFANHILKQIEILKQNTDTTTPEGKNNAYTLGEHLRRFSFEYNGMRNHEIYFETLENGPRPLNTSSDLYKKIIEQWGSFDLWKQEFTTLALTRGIGWAMLTYDKESNTLLHHWIDEQHLGQLQGTQVILALDMWEHSYVHDYLPSGKKKYIEDFFININWDYIASRF